MNCVDCFIYDEESYIFLGIEKAQESPREQGHYLLPPCSTLISPPKQKEGYNIVYDESSGSWYYEKDEDYYNDLCHIERLWRDNELYSTDIFMIPDYPISLVKRFKIKLYRKRLRRWPKHPNFPHKEYRPKSPL